MKLNALKLGYAGAIVAALDMLGMSILASLGIYEQATMEMAKWHMWYSMTVVGTITGMIEAAVLVFVMLYVFGLIYNALLGK